MNPKEKAFIYFTDNRPAVYPEAEPTVNECKGFLDFMDFHCKWQSSFLAYMKEPPFEYNDVCYDLRNGKKLLFIRDTLHNDAHVIVDVPDKNIFYDIKFEYLSHFRPGQQIDLSKFKYVREEMCIDCGGDGEETCNNPDHAFIDTFGSSGFDELGRLGCPVCGHDEDHKVPNGGDCETCNRTRIEWQEVKEPTEADKQSGKVLLTPEQDSLPNDHR